MDAAGKGGQQDQLQKLLLDWSDIKGMVEVGKGG
jgi:hypothetical protein